MGAIANLSRGKISFKADKLVGSSIYMDVVSVGATINTLIASIFAEGTTTIDNAAKEPHVVDVANFLNSLGADIRGARYGFNKNKWCKIFKRKCYIFNSS